MKCPGCYAPMDDKNYNEFESHACRYGCGLWLRKGSKLHLIVKEKIKTAHFNKRVEKMFEMKCPECELHLHKMRVQQKGEYYRITPHVCTECAGVFLNNVDFKLLRKKQKVSIHQKQTIANSGAYIIEKETIICNDTYYEKYEEDRDIEVKDYLFSLLTGMPVEINLAPQKKPVITFILLAINILAFIMLASYEERIAFALVPASAFENWRSFFTCMFMHANIMHLLGNMYFLYVFGDNVEDRLGVMNYILFYFLCGIFASLAHIAFHLGSYTPMVGASGAISGLMGGYLLACRKAKIGAVILFIPIKVPAFMYFVFWIFIQLLLSMSNTNIAWDAHLGGFFSGLILYPIFKNVLKRTHKNGNDTVL